MKRIFVALSIGQELQSTIADWQTNLPELPVKWLKEKNLHITLVPPWQTDRVREAEVALEQLSGQFPSFNLQFDEAALGPDQFHPRLVWATDQAPKQCLDLKQGIEQALMYKPDRPFNLHLTTARFREQDKALIPDGLFPQPVLWQQPVTSFVLMESQLLADGAEYTVLQEIPLAV